MIKIRPIKYSDAERLFEILNNDNFLYFGVRPKSIEEELNYIKEMIEKSEKGVQYAFVILLDDLVVGGIGLKINQQRQHIAEIGYFVDESYHSKGIATKAVKLIEEFGIKKGIKRFEIIMELQNKASERVAIKSGYEKEGVLRKVIHNKRAGEYRDAYIYSKIV